jgi:glycerol-3-phosphate O-acyltransferase
MVLKLPAAQFFSTPFILESSPSDCATATAKRIAKAFLNTFVLRDERMTVAEVLEQTASNRGVKTTLLSAIGTPESTARAVFAKFCEKFELHELCDNQPAKMYETGYALSAEAKAVLAEN